MLRLVIFFYFRTFFMQKCGYGETKEKSVSFCGSLFQFYFKIQALDENSMQVPMLLESCQGFSYH